MTITFKIHGTIKGGKNNMGITPRGIHYPKKSFKEWRDHVVSDLREFFQNDNSLPITKPCKITLAYTPADKRKRDIPAILDSIFHIMERANIVEDDCLFEEQYYKKFPTDKKDAGVEIVIEELK